MKSLAVSTITFAMILFLISPAASKRVFAQGDTWVAKAPMPISTNGGGSGVILDKLFVVAGGAAGQGVAALQEYDPTTDTWSERTPIPTTRPGAGVGAIADTLYVAGGCPPNGGCGGSETNLLEAYDTNLDTWSTLSPMPTPRSALAAGVINGKLYVAGGIGPNMPFQSLTTLEVYDPTADSWTTKAPMPIASQNAAAAIISGKLYIVGGAQGNTVLDELEVYDPATDTWEIKAPMPTATLGAAAGSINGQLHVVGGTGNFGDISTHQVFDPVANTWTTAAPMPTAREGQAAGVIEGRFYVAGGNASGVPLNVLEAYTPPTQLTTLGFANIWVGLKNSDDVGTKFDLLGEVLRNGDVIASSQLNDVPGGSSGFNNAILDTINLALSGPVTFSSGDSLSIRLSVRVAASSKHRSGTARLWFNDAAANSRFNATIDAVTEDYFLVNGSALNTFAGAGPKQTRDVLVDRAVGGNPFKAFGAWTKVF